MSEPIRVSTTYSMPLDQSTVDLLVGAPLGPISELQSVLAVWMDVRGRRILYTVTWGNDNPYVHKAIRKALRTWIGALKILEPSP